MPDVQRVLSALERIAPSRFALPQDRVGLQVGDSGASVQCGVVTLDWSDALLDFAEAHEANLIVAHHPLIWDPIESVNQGDLRGRAIARLCRMGAAYIACHTNWDAAPGGISDTLAEVLMLREARPFGSGAAVPYLKLVTFCPAESVQVLLDRLAAAGAGVIGLYERCAFTSPGTGTFRGLEGSKPAVGHAGRVENVPEVRIEMRVPKSAAAAAEAALKGVHPYEEPAYDFYDLIPTVEMPMGRIGALPRPMSLYDFLALADERLDTRSLAWGNPDRLVRTVAVAGGSADGLWREAKLEGADVLLTGEARQHVALEASQSGLAIVASGHFATEQPGCASLRSRLSQDVPEVRWELFEPDRGSAGRPL